MKEEGQSMAQRVQIILEDDFDGTEADDTVLFGLDGAEYEVDLSADNAQRLRDALAPWVAVARKTGGRRKRASTSASATKSPAGTSTGDIRAWAQTEPVDLDERA